MTIAVVHHAKAARLPAARTIIIVVRPHLESPMPTAADLEARAIWKLEQAQYGVTIQPGQRKAP